MSIRKLILQLILTNCYDCTIITIVVHDWPLICFRFFVPSKNTNTPRKQKNGPHKNKITKFVAFLLSLGFSAVTFVDLFSLK